MNDTISKDPRAIAEAVAAANRKPAPTLPYDLKAVYAEEWAKAVDAPFNAEGPGDAWAAVQKAGDRYSKLDIAATLSESDFRSFARSDAHGWVAKKLTNMAAEQAILAKSHSDIAKHNVMKGLGNDACLNLDIATGCVRKHDCKAGDVHSGDVVELLKTLLGAK